MTTGPYIAAAKTIDPTLPETLWALVLPGGDTAGPTLRVCAVGDVVFSNGVKNAGEHAGYGTLFDEIAPFLKSSAALFANLECALDDRPQPPGGLVGVRKAAASLALAGITVANLANNHSYDAGAIGLASTLEATRTNGLIPLGAAEQLEDARSLRVMDLKGYKIGWLGCGRTLQPQVEDGPRFWEFNEAELLDSIQAARGRVHTLFVSIHIGYEYIEVPSPEHQDLTHRCVAAGANIVLMHHPHVLQGLERVGEGGIVCYSLGNCLMDPKSGHVSINTMLEQRRTGAVFVFDVGARGGCSVAVLPTYTDEAFCVRWALGEQGHAILNRLLVMTAFLKSRNCLAAEFARQRAERNLGPVFIVLWHHLIRGHWRILKNIFATIRPRHLLWLMGMLRIRIFGTREPAKSPC